MDIREHCISSFFFHCIAVLLLAALSQYQQRVPQTLTVLLSGDSFGSTSKAAEPNEGAREVGGPELSAAAEKRADETVAETVENRADVKADTGEEPEAVPGPQNAPEVPQTTAADTSNPQQDAMRLAAFHHSFAIHRRIFIENSALSLQQALNKERESDQSGALSDGTAEVTFYFDDEGGIREVMGASSSEGLMAVLRRLDWRSAPSPGAYRIRMRGLHVMIKIDRGEPSFFFTVL